MTDAEKLVAITDAVLRTGERQSQAYSALIIGLELDFRILKASKGDLHTSIAIYESAFDTVLRALNRVGDDAATLSHSVADIMRA